MLISPSPLSRNDSQYVFSLAAALQRVVSFLNNGPTTVTQDTEASYNGQIILADASSGAITVSLPDAGESIGMRLTAKKLDSSGNAVTLQGSQNIDGAASKGISTQYQTVTLISDGVEWWIIG